MVQRVGVKFGEESSNTIRNNYQVRSKLQSGNKFCEVVSQKNVMHYTDEKGNQTERVIYFHTKGIPYSLDKHKRWEFVDEQLKEEERDDLSSFEKKQLRKIANREAKKQQNELKHSLKHSNVRKALKQTEDKQQEISEEEEEEKEEEEPVIIIQDHTDLSHLQQEADILISMVPEKHKTLNKFAKSGDRRIYSNSYYERLKHKLKQEPVQEIQSIFASISKCL